jgi:hypothetical protein
MKYLSEEVKLNDQFRRSINIGSDTDKLENLEGYICPASAEESLKIMIKHITQSSESSFTWTGPFGSGKSSLALLVSALINQNPEIQQAAKSKISSKNTDEVSNFFCQNQGWNTLNIVGTPTSPLKAFQTALELDDNTTAEEIIQECITRSQSKAGLVIFVDEMGKFLEFQASSNSDIYFFQLLAEAANRSYGKLVFIGILHQAFSEYARSLTKNIKDEWSKIQGRFTDITINISNDEQLELISQTIQSEKKPKRITKAAKATADCIGKNRRTDEELLARKLTATWPLHPVTSLLISELSRKRFGQNQRSIFSFLLSAEPEGFKDFLKNTSISSKTLFTPSNLWDYLSTNLESTIIFSADAKAWAVASEAISKCDTSDDKEKHSLVLKAIAVISIFKGRSGLEATKGLLESIFNFEINNILADLQKWSFTIYKKHTGSYSLYEGSDFDIDEAVANAGQKINNIDISRINHLAGIKPVVAKRHYHKTGALRWLKLGFDFVDANTSKRILNPKNNGSEIGHIVCLLPKTSQELETALEVVNSLKNDPVNNAIIGVASNYNEINNYVSELITLEWISNNEASLSGDSIARREVESRITSLSNALEKALFKALMTTPWVFQGSQKVYALSELSELASNVADSLFHQSPIVLNEMLNRDKPSGNANAALKALAKAMVSSSEKEHLGIEGYPPERGLYESILKKNYLHVDSNGWTFAQPNIKQTPELSTLWKTTNQFLSKQDSTLKIADIYSLWNSEPFGVKAGLNSILLLSYILSNKEKVAVYIDETYYPNIDDYFVDYLLGSPKDVSIRFVEANQKNEQFLNSAIATLNKHNNQHIKLNSKAEPLEVARALVQLITQQNKWVHRTKRLSKETTLLREAILNANDPNKLLFESIPDLLEKHNNSNFEDLITELTNAFPYLIQELGQHILLELQVGLASTKNIEALRNRAARLKGKTGNFRVDALASRLSIFDNSVESISGIASLAANKPIFDWIDQDVQRALQEISALCHEFNKAELLVRVEGKPSEREAIGIYIKSSNSSEMLNAELELLNSEKEAIKDLKAKFYQSMTNDLKDTRLQKALLTSLIKDLISQAEGEQKNA